MAYLFVHLILDLTNRCQSSHDLNKRFIRWIPEELIVIHRRLYDNCVARVEPE